MTKITELIRNHLDEIVHSWSAEAAHSASAQGLGGPRLTNFLPLFVEALANAGDELGRMGERSRELVEGHIGARMREGFDLVEIVAEFFLLGPCVAQIADRLPADSAVDPAGTAALLLELHLAASHATRTFAVHMRDDEQAQKRAARRMETIVSQHAGGGAPANEWLPALVEVARGALEAECAALLLFDARTNELEAAAAAGTGEEELKDFASALDPRTFAGRVASSDEVTSVIDMDSTELKLPDRLREHGIRALMGVRLPQHGRLVGVLYVGQAKSRAFSPGEVRRIESLGERIALHLENAALQRELAHRIADLEEERTVRDRFVAVIAHDLRGPLGTAKLSAAALRRTPDNGGRCIELATRIETVVDRAARMIDDLLDTQRVRAGHRLMLNLERCDLAEICRQVVEDLDPAAQNRVVVEGGATSGVWGAETLRRAIWNLVTNALKFGEAGTPVDIHVESNEERARVAVHNFGEPIDLEDRESIFKAFARAPGAERSHRPGWGLGLTLVRGCAEAHGGTIEVASAKETGTTFTIAVPLDARPYQPAGENTQEQEPVPLH